MKLFFDTQPYLQMSTSDVDTYTTKTQIILFTMINLKHEPIVSFVWDELRYWQQDPLEKMEIYIPEIDAKISDNILTISVDTEYYKFECTFDGYQFTNSFGTIKKTKFNNFNYIEKSIIDIVQDDIQPAVESLIAQVKKITEHLADGN